jgi:hypothetical protein
VAQLSAERSLSERLRARRDKLGKDVLATRSRLNAFWKSQGCCPPEPTYQGEATDRERAWDARPSQRRPRHLRHAGSEATWHREGRQCVTYARQNRPEWSDEKARKAVARMIAEEPTG